MGGMCSPATAPNILAVPFTLMITTRSVCCVLLPLVPRHPRGIPADAPGPRCKSGRRRGSLPTTLESRYEIGPGFDRLSRQPLRCVTSPVDVRVYAETVPTCE